MGLSPMVGKPERRCLFLVQTNISGSNPLPGTWFFLIIVFSWNAATCEGRGIWFFTYAMTSYDCTPFFSLFERGYHIYNIFVIQSNNYHYEKTSINRFLFNTIPFATTGTILFQRRNVFLFLYSSGRFCIVVYC